MSPHPHLRVWSCATNTTTFIGFLKAKFETLNVGIDKQNDDLNIQCYFFSSSYRVKERTATVLSGTRICTIGSTNSRTQKVILANTKLRIRPIDYRCEDGRFFRCLRVACQCQSPIRSPTVKQGLFQEK